MKKLILVVIAAMGLSAVASADEVHMTVESWGTKGILKCVKRTDAGRFVDSGALRFETWRSSEESQWACRNKNGQLLYGATGQVEKFKVKAGERERTRVVFRDGDGQFVTWMDLTRSLKSGWEKYGQGNSRYVIRQKNSGRILNSAFGQIETGTRNDGRNVCAVRDTADGQNNGKYLTWIVADANGKFHDPATGRFVSCRNPR